MMYTWRMLIQFTPSINSVIEYDLFKEVQFQRQAEDEDFCLSNNCLACVFSPPAKGRKRHVANLGRETLFKGIVDDEQAPIERLKSYHC
ncbi:MAG: hypothetical protein Pg6B_01460 [Candidatus Azobacteroides pseudotrichonymphae]|nr:MAG: hypothetical protein Pg6B_01460 [Candidatus Azobacteroides pseudotrichonymphae]